MPNGFDNDKSLSRARYKRQLEQWEKEGYDVSELRRKWFPQRKEGLGTQAKIWISIITVLIIVIAGVVIWQVAKPTSGTSQLPPSFSLSTSASPSIGGNINPAAGSHTYTGGAQVTITATPASGYTFSHWSGSVSGTSPTVTVTMNSNKNVIANFIHVVPDRTLTVGVSGQGSTNPAAGSHTYPDGSQVTITATPASGYRFSHWSGSVTGTSATVTVTMNSNKNVVANFEKLYQTIQRSMGASFWSGSHASYTKTLGAGETVDGSVELTGTYFDWDWSYSWDFRVLGPGGEQITQWTGHWVNNNYHEFEFIASYAGTYTIKVYHGSSRSKNLTINIWPPGWQ